MVETKEHIEHDKVGNVEAIKDDIKEDAEDILEEKEVIETNLTD